MRIIILYASFFFIIILLPFTIYAQQSPSTEIRGVWLTTNWNLDWPRKGQSPSKQKEDLTRILDQFQKANINTVFFQARLRGDVFYKSDIEPWSPFFLEEISFRKDVAYDPLQYVIEECHKRGMECHAWFVTFSLGGQSQIKKQGSYSIVSKHPEWCKLYDRTWYLDPGVPEARNYLVTLVEELIGKYDVDGIHFDYIRYPDGGNKFPDKDTYRRYSDGEGLRQWRLDNITKFVTKVYDRVKEIKPWVQVSCSPLGRYRSLDARKGTWTAYESVYQDAGLWLQNGKMDAVYPMLYYNDELFDDYVEDWLSMSDGRIVAPGLGVYRLLPNEGNWHLNDVTSQMDYIRQSRASGVAFYRASNVLDNTKGILDKLEDEYYARPAKLPPMKWLDNVAPAFPKNVKVYKDSDNRIAVEWEPFSRDEDQTFNIYMSPTENADINDERAIQKTGIHANKIYLKIPESEAGIYISITASDRYHNESVPSFPVYFIPSNSLEK